VFAVPLRARKSIEARKWRGAGWLGSRSCGYARSHPEADALALAAREVRVSLWEMMDYVKTKKITAQYDLEDFQQDLKTVAAGERR
jgi:hypothetical protein